MSTHNDDAGTCIACDCVDETYHFTTAGAGPFCNECWEHITDPDSTLLLEQRLADYEASFDELTGMIRDLVQATDAGCAWPDGLYERMKEVAEGK